jgi:hypothetical protein
MTRRMELASSISRRDLLKAGGAMVVSFAFGAIPLAGAHQTAPAAGVGGKPLDPGEVDSFLAIHADGSITVYTGKVDVGTGMRIAVAQMAAEELGVAAGRISIVDGDTGLCPNQGGTGGSTGLTRGGAGVRRAAATARQELLTLGAARLNRPAADLTIADGVVRPLTGGRGVGIGALVGGRRLSLKVDPNAPLIAPPRYNRRRQATSETGCARQVHRALRLRPRLQRAGNAARPGRPPASHGRNAPVRGRVVHPGHSRRPHRADRKFSGCGREGRVGGGAYRPCARDDMERMAGTTNRPRTTSPWRWRSRWIGRAAGLPSGG